MTTNRFSDPAAALAGTLLVNHAFHVAMLLFREVSRSTWDGAAIDATLTIWQRCCPVERRDIVRMLWDLAQQAAEEGQSFRSRA